MPGSPADSSLDRVVAQEASDFIKELEVSPWSSTYNVYVSVLLMSHVSVVDVWTGGAGDESVQVKVRFRTNLEYRLGVISKTLIFHPRFCAFCSPYDVLDLKPNATDNEIKKQYRKKSLLIHPDKFKHPKGIEVSLFFPLFPNDQGFARLMKSVCPDLYPSRCFLFGSTRHSII